jgi:MFS family permease
VRRPASAPVPSDRRLIVLLCLTMLVNAVSMGAFPPLLPEVGSGGRLADWQLGFLAGAFGLARTIADIPVGLFVRRDLRRALLVAPLGLIGGAVCLGTAGSFPVLILGRALMGIGHTLAIVSGLTAILQYRAAGRLAASLNAFEFSAIVGMLGGVMLVGALPAGLGWNVAYLLACAPLGIGLALVPGLLRSLPMVDSAPAASVASDAETTPEIRRDSGSAADGPQWSVSPLVVLAFIAGAFVAVSYALLEQFVIALRGSREFGLDRAGIARLLAVAQFCDLLLLLPLGALADRLQPARVLGPVLLLIAAAVAAITFGGFTLVVLGCVLFGAGMAGWMLPLSLLRQETPAHLVAWRTGVYRVGVDGGLFLGPFIGGLLGERRVGWLAALSATVLIGTATMLLLGPAGSPRVAQFGAGGAWPARRPRRSPR